MKNLRYLKKSVSSSVMVALMIFSSVLSPLQASAKPVNAVNDIEKISNVGTAKALSNINAFTVSDTILMDDYCINATQKEIDYLKKFDVDKLLAGFRETAGLDMKGETRYDGWENSLIGGHCVGHYLSALAQAYDSINVSESDKAALLAIMKPLINGLKECQEQSGSHGNSKPGYLFGATLVKGHEDNVEIQFDNVENNRTNLATESWVPWYTMHKILAGLLDIAEIQSNNEEVRAISATALEIAKNLGEWVYNRTKEWSDATRAIVLNIEYGGMNDVLYELYNYTKNDDENAVHFKEAAHLFDEDALFERVYNSEEGSNVLSGLHANTTIPKFLGALKGYVVCEGQDGTADYMKYAEKFWDMVVKHNTYITGDNSEWEHFRTVDELDANRTNCNCETCNAYNMLKMSRLLFQLTGEKKYADFYENTFQNTILSSQNPETGMTTYFQPMATGYFKVYGTEFTKFWCCTGSGMESFTKLNDSIYFYKDNNLIVNQFISSKLNWTEQNLVIEQESDIPNTEETKLIVSKLNDKEESTSIELYLRIPDWAADQVSVKVNETEYKLTEDKVTENGYAIVSDIKADDTISYTIPMEVVPYTLQDAEGSVFAFKYGPVVLSAELEAVDWENNSTITGVDVTIPASKRVDSETVAITAPVDSVAAFMENINDYMVRDASSSDLAFDLEGTNTNLRFTTHYKQYKNRYGIYWYFVQDEESISAAVISGKETARLNDNKIGESIRPGYTQDETTIADYGNGSTANASPNYRFANENGSFSYDVMVDITRDNYLITSFYKEDYDADKTIQMIVGDNVVVFSGTLKELEKAYNVNVADDIFTAEILLSKQVISENAYDKDGEKYLKITFSGAPVAEDGSDSNSEDGKVVYFVDCGDYDVTTLSDGDAFGTRNSVTDQIYGKDSKTNYSWGIVDDTDVSTIHGDAEKGVFTNHTWAFEFLENGDGEKKEISNRYTKNQFEEGIDRHLEYDFELSAGTYFIEAGFANPWDVSSPVQVKVNDQVISESLEIPNLGNESAQGTVTLEEDGVLQLTATTSANCINMAYIIIKKTASAPAGDTFTQESARICSTLYIRGAYSNNADLSSLKLMDMSDNDITDFLTWDKEKKEIKVTLPESYTENVQIQFTLEDSNGYLTLNDYAIDDTKAKTFDMETSRILSYPVRIYAEDHTTYQNYTLTLYKEYTIDEDITYFVDCGDYNVTTVSDGDAFGTNNSVTEQLYGKDPVTGKTWGVLDKNGTENTQGGIGNAIFTAYTWANEANPVDGSSKTNSFRYTKNQYEILNQGDANGIRYLDYAFELEAGTYDIEIGMSDPWNCSSYPSVYLNYNDETKESMKCLLENTRVGAPIKDSFTMENSGEVSLNFRGTGSNTLAINVSYIIIKPSNDGSKPEEPKYETIYFVDCGDYDVTTVSEGDTLGTHNSVTDQIYGKDAKTGYSWGIVDDEDDGSNGPLPEGIAAGGIYTAHTWAYEANNADGLNKTVSNRYTKNQFENGVETRYLDYAFELEDGTYEVEIGFSNPWSCSGHPSVFATMVTGSSISLSEDVNVPNLGTAIVKESMEVTGGILTLSMRGTGDTLAINVTHIIIKKEIEEESDDNPDDNQPEEPDDNKPEDNNTNNSNNNGASNIGNSGNNNTSNTDNNTEDNNTKDDANSDNSTENTTITEEKPDGTIVTTVTEEKSDGTIVTTITEEKPDGVIVTTVTEKTQNGSSTETKEIKEVDGNAVFTAIIETDTAGKTSANAVISTGVSDANNRIKISKGLLENIAVDDRLNSVTIAVTDVTIDSAAFKKNTIVNINISSVEDIKIEKIVLTQESIQAAKETGRGVRVNVITEEDSSNSYTVIIPVKQIAKVDSSIKEFNVTVNVDNIEDVTDSSKKSAITKIISNNGGNNTKTCVVSIAADKDIKAGMKITVPITGKAAVSNGSNVYVYMYNTETGKLEETANCQQILSDNGSVFIEAFADTDYVISAQKLSGNKVETIEDNISISVSKKTVKQGKKRKVKISLPSTVSTKSKFAAQKATISYKLSNSKVAKISSAGVLTAKKKGSVTVTATIKLEDGQKITKKVKMTVK